MRVRLLVLGCFTHDSQRVLTAVGSLHLCALNCCWMSAWASGCPLKGSCDGNCVLQNSQIPST